MEEEHIIIGEGTFGTVIKPALPCAELAAEDLSDRVSKVLRIKDAESEYREFDKLIGLPRYEQYHIERPLLCKITEQQLKIIEAQNGNVINKKNEDGKYIRDESGEIVKDNNPENFRILQYKYGGRDLDNFSLYLKNFPQEGIERFWKSTVTLWEGIGAFSMAGFSNGDIKPQNIVYNSDTNELKFIDPGNMESIKDLLDGTKKREFLWNYPYELSIEGSVVDIKKLTAEVKDKTTFLKYTENKTEGKIKYDAAKIKEIVTTIAQCFSNDLKGKSIITTDSYGLAGSLCFIANQMYEKGKLNITQYNQIYGVLSPFFEKCVSKREIFNEDTVSKYTRVISSINWNESMVAAPAPIPKAKASRSKAAASPRASPPKAAASPPKAAASPPRETASKTGKMATSSSSGSDKSNKTRRKRVKSEAAKSQEEAKPQEQKSRKRNKPQVNLSEIP